MELKERALDSKPAELQFTEVTGLDDPLWPEWKAIYEASFDVSERMSDAFLQRTLAAKVAGGSPHIHFGVLQTTDEPCRVAAIAMFDADPAVGAGYLGYLATRADLRNRGLGRPFYAEIVRQCISAGVRLLLFEVEIPEVAAARHPRDGELSRRRIAWYNRQGAKLLVGIHYLQAVDTGVPPTEMHLMAHTFRRMTAEEVFLAAKRAFGDALEQTGHLSLA